MEVAQVVENLDNSQKKEIESGNATSSLRKEVATRSRKQRTLEFLTNKIRLYI
jgi:hypothetical protein